MKTAITVILAATLALQPKSIGASTPTPDVDVRPQPCGSWSSLNDVFIFVGDQCSLVDDQTIQRMLRNAALEHRRTCNSVPTSIRAVLYAKGGAQNPERSTPLAEAFFSFKTTADSWGFAKLDPIETPTLTGYKNIYKQELERSANAIALVTKNGARASVNASDLTRNPFVFEGKLLVIRGTFSGMLSRSEAQFDSGNSSFIVAGVPATSFRDKSSFLIVGRGQGQGKHQYPQINFVGATQGNVDPHFVVREAWLKRRSCQLVSPSEEAARQAEVEQYKRADEEQTASALARFHDNQDGTITDAGSGLTWIRNSLYLSDLARAKVACTSSGFAGQTGWRIPNKAEWETLLDPTGVHLMDTPDRRLFGQKPAQNLWILDDLGAAERFHNLSGDRLRPLDAVICLDEPPPERPDAGLMWASKEFARYKGGYQGSCGGRGQSSNFTCVRGTLRGGADSDSAFRGRQTDSTQAQNNKVAGATGSLSQATSVDTASGVGTLQPSPQAAFVGRWVGQIKWGLASSVAVVTLTGTTPGEAAGTTQYTKDRESSPYCEGTLIAAESADGQYVFQEQIVRTRGLECPGGGTLRISMPDGVTANAAWDNRHKPGKAGFRGMLKKQ